MPAKAITKIFFTLYFLFVYFTLNLTESSNEQKAIICLNIAATFENSDTAKAKEYADKSIKYQPTNNAYQVLANLAKNKKNYKQSEIISKRGSETL